MNRFFLVLLFVWFAAAASWAASPSAEERRLFETVKAQAENGDAASQLSLGTFYANGAGVTKNLRQAFKWHRKAGEQGLARAQYQVGLDYAVGEGVKMDKAEALVWFQRAAEGGLAVAQFSVGLSYEKGRGVDENDATAVRWFREAAAQNFPDAESELGLCYLEGRGATKDILEGVKWLQRAAEHGSATGQSRLARCFERGTGVLKDNVQAYKWFALAAAQDEEQAPDLRVDLARLESLLSPEQITAAQKLAREFKPRLEQSSAQVLTPSSPPQPGVVKITAEEGGCEIFVDGQLVGNPPAALKLAEGNHAIEARKAGFKTFRTQLTVGAGAELSLQVKLDRE